MLEAVRMQSLIRETKNVAEWVSLASIKTREQPRHYFDPDKLEQLVQSIAQHGILEPLLVRPVNTNQYELVAGERRYRAALKLGLPEVPVVIRQLNDEEAIQLALIENLQREDLNPIEETEGILQLLAFKLKLPVQGIPSLLYQMKNMLEKEADLRAVEGRNNVIPSSRAEQEREIQAVFQDLGLMNWLSFTCNRLPLLNLPDEILTAIRSGQIAYTKALAIARIKDQAQRQTLLNQAIAENLSLNQIRACIKAIRSKPELQPPEVLVMTLHRRLLKAKLWEDPQRWTQAQTLLSQLEALLDQTQTNQTQTNQAEPDSPP
ncbi:MAG: ParB/RepB/Spo0J family partition protein [Pegethrix bostrychoides GSE-TBD4-15B]|uniref:ParB/RepB/Spo0J family partition protein n=1 Tax=Pegethrix bostrychoides GSE-TBD4-15B TaxID=2839662 RepID=A0A951PDT5_9CYAN|nr:ParB/RepB/Spo0J family partition protein [Pegethrix bostrychoides GSE-TBD4-15B]